MTPGIERVGLILNRLVSRVVSTYTYLQMKALAIEVATKEDG